MNSSDSKELPEASKELKKEWWEVFYYKERPDSLNWRPWAEILGQYKTLAKIKHPDTATGSKEAFQELQNALSEARVYYGED
jgi:hypothetical protein